MTKTPEPESNEESQPKPPIEETPHRSRPTINNRDANKPNPSTKYFTGRCKRLKIKLLIEVDNDNENKSEQTKDKKEVGLTPKNLRSSRRSSRAGFGSRILACWIYNHSRRNRRISRYIFIAMRQENQK